MNQYYLSNLFKTFNKEFSPERICKAISYFTPPREGEGGRNSEDREKYVWLTVYSLTRTPPSDEKKKQKRLSKECIHFG